MVIDFTKVNAKERPVIVLRNPDGTALQTLGYAKDIELEVCYNETSTLSFSIPAWVDGESVPGYDLVVGSRIVDVVGWGQFILIDPSTDGDGVQEIKSCKAYSLEYELTYKRMSLEESTYNFWNPVSPASSILGIIMTYLPSWRLGEVSSMLTGKYRTFSLSNENIYNFMKSTLQDTYGCIFEFDTYERLIHVRSTSDPVKLKPIYISLDNLATDIKLTEDTENIFTVLDVNGAEGVTIRSVNPTGTNKIYNLDYYIDAGLIPQTIASKWQQWKSGYESAQLAYFNTTVERMMRTAAIVTKQSARATLQADYDAIDVRRSVLLELLASLSKSSASRTEVQEELNTVNRALVVKTQEIEDCDAELERLNAEKAMYSVRLVAMNKDRDFSNYFSEEEMVILDRFFKEDSIEDGNFVAQTADAYIDGEVEGNNAGAMTLLLSGGVVETATIEETGRTVWTVKGGSIESEGTAILSAEVVRASLERAGDGTYIMSAYLANGEYNVMEFAKGCLSMTGSCGAVTSGTTSLRFSINEGSQVYFTKNTSEYERLSVEWDLYEYGQQCLAKLAYPSYTFDVSSANFFSLDDFASFASQFSLGDKLYLDLGSKVITPISVGFSINFDDKSSLKLKFGSTFNLGSSSFELVDLLEQSVSMGKTVDTNRYLYSSFVSSGASTAVKDFMESALDVSKNAILSGKDISVTWDASGIKAKKWNHTTGSYDREQLAIINNSIVFTDNAWESSTMAIGKFYDENTGESWGVVAPNIVGTLLASSQLVVESEKKSGETAVFRVDGDGAYLYNASFELVDEMRHIVLDPMLGFGIGAYPIVDVDTSSNERSWNVDNTNFWVDTDGNVHFKGILEGASGRFTGEIAVGGTADNPNFYVDASGNMTANSGEFNGTVHADKMLLNGENIVSGDKIQSKYLNLGRIKLDGTTGNVTIGGDIVLSGNIDMSQASSIAWGRWDPADGNGYSESEIKTFIDEKLVAAPTIAGGEFRGLPGSAAYNTRLVISGYGSYNGMKLISSSDSTSNSGLFMITGTSTAAVVISHNRERFFFFPTHTAMAGTFAFSEGSMYGTSSQMNSLDAVEGQLFFVKN